MPPDLQALLDSLAPILEVLIPFLADFLRQILAAFLL